MKAVHHFHAMGIFGDEEKAKIKAFLVVEETYTQAWIAAVNHVEYLIAAQDFKPQVLRFVRKED